MPCSTQRRYSPCTIYNFAHAFDESNCSIVQIGASLIRCCRHQHQCRHQTGDRLQESVAFRPLPLYLVYCHRRCRIYAQISASTNDLQFSHSGDRYMRKRPAAATAANRKDQHWKPKSQRRLIFVSSGCCMCGSIWSLTVLTASGMPGPKRSSCSRRGV